MPKIYSEDFRLQAVSCVKRGKSHEEVCEFFGIGIATLYRWPRLGKTQGSVSPVLRSTYKSGKICPDNLPKELDKFPAATLYELAEKFDCCFQNVDYRLKKLGITRKKTHYTQSRTRKIVKNFLPQFQNMMQLIWCILINLELINLCLVIMPERRVEIKLFLI